MEVKDEEGDGDGEDPVADRLGAPRRRQVGGAIGVSIMAVILGAAATRSAAMDRFDHMCIYAAAMALACGAICLLLNPRSGRPAEAPVTAG